MSHSFSNPSSPKLPSSPTLQEHIEYAEHQPLWTSSQADLSSEVSDFTTSHGLQHKLDVFRKASLLLSSDSPSSLPALTTLEASALRNEISHKWRQPPLLYFTIATCSLGAIEQGWAQTSMNGANLSFPAALGLTSGPDATAKDTFIVGLINSAIYLSVGLWGAWLSEPLNNRFGRRGTIFIGSVCCAVANGGSAVSASWGWLLFFRLLLGTGLGVNASTVSVYAAECAPAAIRGGLAVSWQMWTAFGIFLGFVANVAVYEYGFGEEAWRWQLGAPFLPVVPLLGMVWLCPEAPAWYVKKGRYDLAYRSLSRLRNAEILAAREIYAGYLQSQAKPRSTARFDSSSSYMSKIVDLFTVPRIRNATLASSTVMLAQQLCGINIITFFSSTIFEEAGFSALGALVASCIFGLINFLGAFPAIWTMDTLGRRSLLLWTLPFMALTMLGAGLSFKLPEGDLQFGTLAVLIYLFCAEYSPGMGPVPSAYSAEVFPLSHREVGMGLAVATANFWAAVLSLTFPGLLAGLGSAGAFELYAALNVLALCLVYLFVRETKRKTLEELDEVFAAGLVIHLKFLVGQQLPWLWRRYVLRKEEAGDKPTLEGSEYRGLYQDENVEDDLE